MWSILYSLYSILLVFDAVFGNEINVFQETSACSELFMIFRLRDKDKSIKYYCDVC